MARHALKRTVLATVAAGLLIGSGSGLADGKKPVKPSYGDLYGPKASKLSSSRPSVPGPVVRYPGIGVVVVGFHGGSPVLILLPGDCASDCTTPPRTRSLQPW